MADSCAPALLMTIDELVRAVEGICLCDYSQSRGFVSVVTDSRKVSPGSLFIPLIGQAQDGHIYIPKALESGASVILVDRCHGEGSAQLFCTLGKNHQASFIVVEDTLRALQDAARAYLKHFPNLTRIGITGSSGKTTTKEIVSSIFAVHHTVVMNEGNLNSETGLPLSVFKVRKEHEIGIFEMGMNREGEIGELARVLVPSIALITNIGTAHIGILGTQEAIAKQKKQIFSFFSHSDIGFVPEDSTWRDYLSSISIGTIKLFGTASLEGYKGYEDLGIDGSTIFYEGLEIHFKLPGKYNLNNALGAIAIARYAGCSALEIQQGLEHVKPIFGRSEIFRGDITVIRDCYNANPDSMESAIGFCDDLTWKGRKIFVLGSMLELGEQSRASHEKICRRVLSSTVNKVYLFGDDMISAGRTVFSQEYPVEYAHSMDSLSKMLHEEVRPGDLVFIKGSRGMELERVCPTLGCKERQGEKA